MKKFYLFLIFSLFSCPVLAQNDQIDKGDGVIKSVVEEAPPLVLSPDAEFLPPVISYPKLSNRLYTDLSFNNNYQTTNRQNEYKETKAKVRFYSRLNLSKNFSLNSYARLDQVHKASSLTRNNASAAGSGDRSFEDEGAFLEELNLEYENDKFALVAGKFNPDFGTAWRWDRGMWVYSLAENYKQTEKLGVDGVLKLGDAKKTGMYDFGLALFTNDRKNLDNSILTQRDSAHKYDGRPGDTRSLYSYIASLDVKFDFAEKEKLSYHFAYMNLAVNERASPVDQTKIDDQKGFVAGMNYLYPFSENFSLDSLIEYTKMWNINGDSDIHEDYFTASFVGKIYQNWNATLATSQRRNLEIDAAGFDDKLSEISFGYEFKKSIFFDKLLFQLGYKHERLDLKTSLETNNSYGALMRYYKAF